MEHAPIVTDTLTWVGFAYHTFDAIWKVVAASAGSFLAGWLLFNKPNMLKKADDPTKQ